MTDTLTDEDRLVAELERQRAWIQHWIEDVRGDLKPTIESLEAQLAAVNAALSCPSIPQHRRP